VPHTLEELGPCESAGAAGIVGAGEVVRVGGVVLTRSDRPRLVTVKAEQEEEDEGDRRRVEISLAPQDLLEVMVTLTPVRAGRRKTMLLVFDRSRWCQGGATSDYATAVVRAQCPAAQPGEACQTAHFYPPQEDVGRLFQLRFTAVDVAGHRAAAPGPPLRYSWPPQRGVEVCWKGW
jgi:hypothetical protein